jgi:hypothetical protein
MSTCSCEAQRQLPQAIIVADTGPNGGISRIRNVSAWNETAWANSQLRQVRWHIFKNGYLAMSSSFMPFSGKIDFAGSKHTPSVSDGAKLNFEDAIADVIGFLASKYIVTLPNDRLEMALEIVNGNNEKSSLSNLILLPRDVNDACCVGLNNYTFVVGNAEHCAIVVSGSLDYCLTFGVAPNFNEVDFNEQDFN